MPELLSMDKLVEKTVAGEADASYLLRYELPVLLKLASSGLLK